MSCQITLDLGTTNTRALLWEDQQKILAQCKSEIGVACVAADGNKHRLEQAVKEAIKTLLAQGNRDPHEVECILASGMVTSNVGLYEVPHLTAPVGLEDLAQGIQRVELPQITSIPFWFIPGVKNRVAPGQGFEGMDMMRGEEVEAVALLEALPKDSPYLLGLPGSHTKFVAAEGGKITGCLTTLTGEMLSVLTRQTILADTVERKFADLDTYSPEMVKLGYHTAKREGLARAAFLARTLRQQAGYTAEQMANYLLGAVLEQDLRALASSSAVTVTRDTKIVLSGKGILCQALLELMQESGEFSNVSVYSPEHKECGLSPLGALAVYRCARS